MVPSIRTMHGRAGRAVAAGSGAWLACLLAGAAVLLALPHPDAPTSSVVRATDAATTSPTLYLQVGPGGDYALDGQPASNVAVERALRDARGQSPDLRLRIDAEGGDPGQLIDALALAEHAGIRNVGSLVH